MFIEYKVYRRVSDLKPFISRDELPSCQMIGKKKFVGKKAKMEAVYRLTDRKSTRLNSSHWNKSRMPSSA